MNTKYTIKNFRVFDSEGAEIRLNPSLIPPNYFQHFFAVLSFKAIVFQQKYVSEIPEIEL